MTVTKITSYEQYRQVINGDKPAIIDFNATWCGPCKVISPIFHKLSSESSSGVDFYEVDTDDQELISLEAGIRAMPTFISYDHGKQVGKFMGANPSALVNLIKQASELSTSKSEPAV
ncbi:putative thioredoxin [Flagelloscypha sp. PMI_526]|nr:putative thioredoxin [Flagelloscypha sp. PMI_526]